jgi:hypothetical protein
MRFAWSIVHLTSRPCKLRLDPQIDVGTDSGIRKRMRSIKTRQSRLLDTDSHRQVKYGWHSISVPGFSLYAIYESLGICRRRGRIILPTDLEYIRDADMAGRDTHTRRLSNDVEEPMDFGWRQVTTTVFFACPLCSFCSLSPFQQQCTLFVLFYKRNRYFDMRVKGC